MKQVIKQWWDREMELLKLAYDYVKLLFTEHPASLGESYWKHLYEALKYVATLLIIVIITTIHAVFPFMFKHTGGDMVVRLSDKITKRTKRKCACATSYVPMKRSTSTYTMEVKTDGKDT